MRWWPCVLLAAGCGRLGFGTPAPDAEGSPPEAALDAPGPDAVGACRTSPLYRSLGSLPHRYRIEEMVQVTWAAAKAVCEADGAYLAIPDDATEIGLLDGDWLGLTDDAVEGQWRTVLGEPAPYLPWDVGEPSGGPSKNCARLEDGLLEARECTDQRDYVCECD